MTALQTRAASEDEADRLALLSAAYAGPYAPTAVNIRAGVLCRAGDWSTLYRPFDKQGEAEPFDLDRDDNECWRGER